MTSNPINNVTTNPITNNSPITYLATQWNIKKKVFESLF